MFDSQSQLHARHDDYALLLFPPVRYVEYLRGVRLVRLQCAEDFPLHVMPVRSDLWWLRWKWDERRGAGEVLRWLYGRYRTALAMGSDAVSVQECGVSRKGWCWVVACGAARDWDGRKGKWWVSGCGAGIGIFEWGLGGLGLGGVGSSESAMIECSGRTTLALAVEESLSSFYFCTARDSVCYAMLCYPRGHV